MLNQLKSQKKYIRRELEHFDEVMREEFGETFTVYHKQYTAALQYNSNPRTVQEK